MSLYVQRATLVTAENVEEIITTGLLRFKHLEHYRDERLYYAGINKLFYSVLTMYWIYGNVLIHRITNVNDVAVTNSSQLTAKIIPLQEYKDYFQFNFLPLPPQPYPTS